MRSGHSQLALKSGLASQSYDSLQVDPVCMQTKVLCGTELYVVPREVGSTSGNARRPLGSLPLLKSSKLSRSILPTSLYHSLSHFLSLSLSLSLLDQPDLIYPTPLILSLRRPTKTLSHSIATYPKCTHIHSHPLSLSNLQMQIQLLMAETKALHLLRKESPLIPGGAKSLSVC